MKVRFEVSVDTETGNWEMNIWNLSHPGQPLDYREIRPLIQKIFNDADKEIMDGIESDERVFKEIH